MEGSQTVAATVVVVMDVVAIVVGRVRKREQRELIY